MPTCLLTYLDCTNCNGPGCPERVEDEENESDPTAVMQA